MRDARLWHRKSLAASSWRCPQACNTYSLPFTNVRPEGVRKCRLKRKSSVLPDSGSALASHTHLGADVEVRYATAELKDRGTPTAGLAVGSAQEHNCARATPLPELRYLSPPFHPRAHKQSAKLHWHLIAGKLARAADGQRRTRLHPILQDEFAVTVVVRSPNRPTSPGSC